MRLRELAWDLPSREIVRWSLGSSLGALQEIGGFAGSRPGAMLGITSAAPHGREAPPSRAEEEGVLIWRAGL